MSRSLFRRFSILAAAAGLAACEAPRPAEPAMVSEWMHTLYGVIRAERLSPPVASRFLGYASVALYSGLAAARPEMPSLAGKLNGLTALPRTTDAKGVDETLTMVEAERVLLDSLLARGLPTTRGTVAGLVDSLVHARAAFDMHEGVEARSRDLGRRVGLAIVAWSRTDGFDSTRGRPYVPPTGPGLWINDTPAANYSSQSLSAVTQSVRIDNPGNTLSPGATSDRGLILSRPKRAGEPTLPAVNPAGITEPYWNWLRPFVLTRWDECPVPGPPVYGTTPDAGVYQNAKAVFDTRAALTPEQKTIALYWADNPGESGTPPGHWTAIAAQMVSQRHLTTALAVRLFALSAVAQADAFIAAWGYKFRFNLIRPRTFIRRVIDPGWEPLIPTPPFPEHPAGHSTQSAAAATVMTALLGDQPFDDSTSRYIGHAVRRFASFGAAADEAGMSRIYGGIHFPSGNEGGKLLGRCIGARVVERAGGPAAK